MANIKLGELLVKANVLQENQLRAALVEQHKWGGKLGDLLVRMSFITEEVLVKALSRQMNVPAAQLGGVLQLSPAVKAKIPLETCRDMAVMPLELKDDGRTLVCRGRRGAASSRTWPGRPRWPRRGRGSTATRKAGLPGRPRTPTAASRWWMRRGGPWCGIFGTSCLRLRPLPGLRRRGLPLLLRRLLRPW
jgi:hypothetical protein